MRTGPMIWLSAIHPTIRVWTGAAQGKSNFVSEATKPKLTPPWGTNVIQNVAGEGTVARLNFKPSPVESAT